MQSVKTNQEVEPPFLSDVSVKDWRWDVQQVNTQEVAGLLVGSDLEESYRARLLYCSGTLGFNVVTESLEVRLAAARFCRVRHCPICQWRRSLKWKARAHQLLPEVVIDYPSHRWLFLTLTVRNCAIACLRQTVQWMHSSFKKLTKRKDWLVTGWIKSLEVTWGKDGLAHPHFHVLLMVPAGYFTDRHYLTQSSWVDLWQKCLEINYKPIVDIRAVHRFAPVTGVIPELLKYQTKPSHMLRDRDWFLQLCRQLHGVKAINVGGVLRLKMRELEQEPEDLIHVEEKSDFKDKECPEIWFAWNKSKKRYQVIPSSAEV